MSTLSDGTIQQIIHKQYLWAVVWKDSRSSAQHVSIFSFWDDAADMRDRLQANGHEAQIDLAVDNTRRVHEVRP